MFDDEELRGAVQELFDEQQETYQRDVIRDALAGDAGDRERAGRRRRAYWNKPAARTHSQLHGFRVFHPSPPKSDARKASLRRYEHKHTLDLIKERILAGERPKLGGRGRPPTRWFQAAAELGIDLQPVPLRKAAREASAEAGIPPLAMPPTPSPEA